jgi:hypothetical protein
VAASELGVGALGPAVSHLHGPDELLLELVGFLLVKLVIGLSQGCERGGELVDRLRKAVEQLLPRVCGALTLANLAKHKRGTRCSNPTNPCL